MNKNSAKVIGNQVNGIIKNINKYLEKTSSKNIANFIYLKSNNVIITTSQTAFTQDMSIFKKTFKEFIKVVLENSMSFLYNGKH